MHSFIYIMGNFDYLASGGGASPYNFVAFATRTTSTITEWSQR